MKYKTLKELCEVISDCPHSTPKWTDHGKIVVRNNNIKNGRIDLSSPSYTDEENFRQRIKRVIPQPGDLIITREAPMGEVGMIPEGIECCLGQRMVLLRANPQECDNYYLLYSIQSREVQHQISWSEGTGTTVSNLRIPHLEQLKIPYLPLKEQEKIVAILKSLDGKIALNNKINENLEQQAQALYREMFLENQNITTATKTLNSIAVITMGQSPSGKSYNEDGIGEVFYQGRAEFGTRFPTRRLFTTEPKRMAEAGDVLLSVRAPVGDLNVAYEKCCIGRGLAAVHSKIGNNSFILYTMMASKPRFDVFNGEGTVFGSINRESLNTMPIEVPPMEMIVKFEDMAHPIDEMIRIRYEENCRLETLRDTLLPKLMNGEIDIEDVI